MKIPVLGKLPVLGRNRADNLRYQPFTDGFAADGALGADWTGATWTVSGGKAINTPTLGAERLTNSEFTADTTGWAGSNATITRRDYATSPDIDPTGGADEFGLEVERTGANAGATMNPAVNLTVGQFYRFAARAYSPSGNTYVNTCSLRGGPWFTGGSYKTTAEDTWQTLIVASRATAASAAGVLENLSTTTGDKAHFDAASVKQATLSECMATVGNCSPDIDISVKITRSTRAACGLVLCVDSAVAPLNFIIGWIDGGDRLTVEKCVGGTWTNLFLANITYVAGAALRLVKSGSTVTAYYNGAQVNVPQTVSDAGIVNNTRHGMFSTDPTVSMDDFSVDKKKQG